MNTHLEMLNSSLIFVSTSVVLIIVKAVSDPVSLCGLQFGSSRCLVGGCILTGSRQTCRDPVSAGLQSSVGQPRGLRGSARWRPHSWHNALLLCVCEASSSVHRLNGACGRVCEHSGQVHAQLSHFNGHLKQRAEARCHVRGGRGNNRIINGISECTEWIVWTSWETDKNLGFVLPRVPPSWGCQELHSRK